MITQAITIEAKGKGARKKAAPAAQETASSGAGSPVPGAGSWRALDIFNHSIQRSKNLLKLHTAAHGRQAKPEKYMSDAHRAAVVLAVSALDAFVRSYVVERVRSILADQTRPLPGPLREKIRHFLKDDDLIEASRRNDLLERVEKAFRADFEKRSFQGTKVIAEHLKLVGVDDVFHAVAKSAKHNEETLCQNLDRFTARRHQIAHRGDYDLTKNPPEETLISKKYASDCIKLVELVAVHIDGVGEAL